jgi:hypothetical protein
LGSSRRARRARHLALGVSVRFLSTLACLVPRGRRQHGEFVQSAFCFLSDSRANYKWPQRFHFISTIRPCKTFARHRTHNQWSPCRYLSRRKTSLSLTSCK